MIDPKDDEPVHHSENRASSLLEWGPGADMPGIGADEVRAWIVELDAGLPPGADVDAAEPGPELAVLSDDERARAARFVRRATSAVRPMPGRAAGDPGAAAGRAGRLAAVPGRRGGQARARSRAGRRRAAPLQRLAFGGAGRSSPSAGAARSAWTSSDSARSPRPSGSSRRSSRRPSRPRSPRSPSRTAPRRSSGAGPARRPCSRDSAWGSPACRRGTRPGSARPA